MYLLYMSVGAALLCFLVLIVLKFFFISKMRLDNRDKKVSSFFSTFKTVKIIPVGNLSSCRTATLNDNIK